MSGVIAVLGFGEAGSLIARDLVTAGATVRGYDPKVPAPDGVTDTASEAEAATGADLILSVNSAKEAVAALTASLDVLDGPAGLAAMRKLLRSVYYKGMVTGTRQHAVRRGAEMAAAAEMLTDLSVQPIMADASRALHERVAAEQPPHKD